MLDHLAGKKHLNLVQFRQLQQSRADRSIFVRGFPLGTTKAELNDVFSKFGQVANVVIISNDQVGIILKLFFQL